MTETPEARTARLIRAEQAIRAERAKQIDDYAAGKGMSHLAWVALGQIAKYAWEDSDLVTKTGRDELLKLGLAERVPMYGVPHLMENRLTKEGRELADRLRDNNSSVQS